MTGPGTKRSHKTLKVGLHAIQFKAKYINRLEGYVRDTNYLTTHTYLLARFIFLAMLEQYSHFDIHRYLESGFFYHCFCQLASPVMNHLWTPKGIEYRNLVYRWIEEYRCYAGIGVDNIPKMTSTASLVAKSIRAAFISNVKMRMGDCLRRAINVAVDTSPETAGLPNKLRSAIKARTKAAFDFPILRGESWDRDVAYILRILKPIRTECNSHGAMQKASLFYDVKCNPQRYLKAVYMCCRFVEDSGFNPPQCFPVRQGFIPCHAPITPAIIKTHLIRRPGCYKWTTWTTWQAVADTSSNIFRRRGYYRFRGYATTDGVSMSVVHERDKKPSKASTKAESGVDTGWKDVDDEVAYLSTVKPDVMNEMKPRFVYSDPGQRDAQYMMAHNSTRSSHRLYRITSSRRKRALKMRYYQRLREKLKDRKQHYLHIDEGNIVRSPTPLYDPVRSMERCLGTYSRTTTYFDDYCRYLVNRDLASSTLDPFYSNTITDSNAYVDMAVPQEPSAPRPAYLRCASVNRAPGTPAYFYTQRRYPIHRRLRLSAHINKQRYEAQLRKELVENFGNDAVYVMGNWSVPNRKYHEPVPGKYWRRLLVSFGFQVFLLDEAYTSRVCPDCSGGVENFKLCKNPRPYMRYKYPKVVCHGLLRCTSTECMLSLYESSGIIRTRLWNRDLLAVLNYRKIVESMCENGERPLLYTKQGAPNKRPPAVCPPIKRRARPLSSTTSSNKRQRHVRS